MKDKNYKIISLYSFFQFREQFILELKDKLLDVENKNINKYLLYLLKEKIIVRPNSIAPNVLKSLFVNTDLKKNLSLIKYKITYENFNNVLENLQKNSLLMQFMKVCPIPDYYIEKNFVKIRKEILNQTYKLNIDKNHINFLISLSMQCLSLIHI